MTPILTLDVPVRITGVYPVQDIDVRITPRYSGAFDPTIFDPSLFDIQWSLSEQAQIAISLDTTLASAALPRLSREQIVAPWRVQVGSTVIPWYRLLSGISVSESIDGITTFSFSAPRRGSLADPYMEPLGSPLTWLGVPGGKQPVTITAEFLTPSGRQSIPLVRDGILDNSSSSVSESGDIRSWNGGGAHARIDKVPVTYQAPPGHGQTSGTIVRRLLTLAGVDPAKIAISGGRRMYKSMSFVDAQVIQSINEILIPESKVVYHDDRSDTWGLLDRTNVGDKRVECIVTESDVLSVLGQLGDESSTDSPTAIVLTGTAQVTREECGRRLDIKVRKVFSVRGVAGAHKVQVGGGPISSVPQANDLDQLLGPGSEPVWQGQESALRLTTVIVDVTEYDCETVISEESVVWGWYSPQMTRYHVGIDGVRDWYSTGYIYDSSAQPDDSAPLYKWISERFVPVSWRRKQNLYNEAGYLSEIVEFEGGWQTRPLPIKDRGVGGTLEWPDVDFLQAWVLADGTAIHYEDTGPMTPSVGGVGYIGYYWFGPSQVYSFVREGEREQISGRIPTLSSPVTDVNRFLSKSVLSVDVDSNGFITSDRQTTTRWFVIPSAGRYLYNSEGESPDNVPVWRKVESAETTYLAVGEANHNRYSTRFDHKGSIIENVEDRNVDGYLPVADQRTDIVPPASTYDDPAEHEFALAASRHENRPLKAEVPAPALGSVLPIWTMKGVTVTYAEDEDDLYATGIQMFRDRTNITVRFPMPFNPLLRPGHRVIVSMPTIGWYYDIIIETTTHTQDDRATFTQIVSRADVI